MKTGEKASVTHFDQRNIHLHRTSRDCGYLWGEMAKKVSFSRLCYIKENCIFTLFLYLKTLKD